MYPCNQAIPHNGILSVVKKRIGAKICQRGFGILHALCLIETLEKRLCIRAYAFELNHPDIFRLQNYKNNYLCSLRRSDRAF